MYDGEMGIEEEMRDDWERGNLIIVKNQSKDLPDWRILTWTLTINAPILFKN